MVTEGDASRALVSRRDAQAVETAEQLHGGLYTQVHLAKEGENGEDGDGVGLEMERMNLIVFKDGEEETGKQRHKAGKEGVQEEGILRDGEIGGPRRARTQGGGPPLVRLGGRQVAHLVHRLLVGEARPLQRALRSGRLCRLHHGLFAPPRGRPVLPRGETSLARHLLEEEDLDEEDLELCVWEECGERKEEDGVVERRAAKTDEKTTPRRTPGFIGARATTAA